MERHTQKHGRPQQQNFGALRPRSQVTRLALCALEIFLRRRTSSGDAVKTPAPSDLASVVLGEDLAVAFPEARVKRVCAGGVLPSPHIKRSNTMP